MAHFRKKPVIIEAVQFEDVTFGRSGNYSIFFGTQEDLPKWLRDALIDERVLPVSDEPPQLVVKTLEGEHFASPGDWIIRGVKGELYPCKPEIFAMTYDPVDEQDVEITGAAI